MHVLVQDWMSTMIPQKPDLALEYTTTLLALSIDEDDAVESYSLKSELELHAANILSRREGRTSVNYGAYFVHVYDEKGQWMRI
jgi:hypothetical protein